MERKFNNEEVKRGEIWLVDLGEAKGCIQGGIRPCIITQNEIGNKYSPTLQCVALTSQIKNLNMPTHIVIECGQGGLTEKSMTLCEQIRPINKSQLIKKYGTLNPYLMKKIDIACNKSLGIEETKEKFNYEYIQKLINTINKLREVLEITLNKQVIEVIDDNIEEIKSYCDKFGVDSSIYTSRYESKGRVKKAV